MRSGGVWTTERGQTTSGVGGTRDRWRAIVPGWPQWRRGQRGRALVLLGSYLSSLAVGLFAWGSVPGAALLGFAAFAHAASLADAIRQAAFPGFGPWAPWFSASVGLGVAGYAPALAVAMQVGFPAWTAEGGYLVDRTAFDERGPEPGHWVWLEPEGGQSSWTVARVVAVGGQVVSWSEGMLRVDGRRTDVPRDATAADRGSRWTFEVPGGALLVVGPGPDDEDGRQGHGPSRLSIVPSDRAKGRAWARSYPIWSRGLLGSAGWSAPWASRSQNLPVTPR